MYEKDKRFRLTLRLSEEQFLYLHESADRIGVSPSEFLRLVIDSCRYSNIDEEASGRENDETNKYD